MTHQKRRDFLRTLALVALAISSIVNCAAGEQRASKTVRLLTVGNSFSQNATRNLAAIAEAAGDKLVHRQAPIGGGSMAQHWDKVLRYEKDPQDKQATYGAKSLKQMLEAEEFDFVTIQQYSFISHDVSTYRPYARNLFDFIKKLQPKAEVLVHQTWAYRRDDPRFAKKSGKPDQPDSQQAMYELLTKAYETIAAELGTRIIPVGDAFFLADNDPVLGFKPDETFEKAKAEYPALPKDQHSLHAGYKWSSKDGTHTLGFDGHHANVAGEYLGGCVFYEVLFGESVVGNRFHPKDIDPDYARFLQETAHKAVQKRKAQP
ncbi:MAG TPA: DUF4886 domain-containing protein [Planctomycetota bacterium]|jgi:hypothetical protein